MTSNIQEGTDNDTDTNKKVDVAIETEEKNQPPDGGWGWLVVFGCVSTLIITGGIQRSGGIFYLWFSDRFQQSATATSWVMSLSGSFGMMSGPIASALNNRFSTRSVVIFGGILGAVSMIISGFTPNLEFLYFSYGILAGFGRSCTHAPALVLVGLYFNKRRGLAIGLSTAGIGLGSFIFPPVADILFNYYGFTGSFIIIAGFILNVVVFGSLFRPLSKQWKLMEFDKRRKMKDPENEYAAIPLSDACKDKQEIEIEVTYSEKQHQRDEDAKPEEEKLILNDKQESEDFIENGTFRINDATHESKQQRKESQASLSKMCKRLIPCTDKESVNTNKPKKKFIELSLLKDYRFLAFGIGMTFYTLAFRIILVFLPAYAKQQRGLSDTQAAFLLSINGIVDTVSRIAAGTILDLKHIKPYRIVVFNILMYLVFAICILIPSLDTFAHLCILSGFMGCVTGSYLSQKSMVVIDILGVEKITSSYGLTMCFQGIGSLIGPAVSGVLKDRFGTWDAGFYFGGVALFLGALLLSVTNFIHYIKAKPQCKHDMS